MSVLNACSVKSLKELSLRTFVGLKPIVFNQLNKFLRLLGLSLKTVRSFNRSLYLFFRRVDPRIFENEQKSIERPYSLK